MTDGALGLAGFGQRAAERRIEKDRVVAEAAVAAWLADDLPFHRAARLEQHAVAVGHRKRADEAGGARGDTGAVQRLVDKRELLGVGAVLAAEAGRLHAWRAAHRIHLEPRVFGHGQLSGGASVIERFLARVLGERGAGLLGWHHRWKVVQRAHVDREPRKEFPDFAQFALVGGRHDEHGHVAILLKERPQSKAQSEGSPAGREPFHRVCASQPLQSNRPGLCLAA